MRRRDFIAVFAIDAASGSGTLATLAGERARCYLFEASGIGGNRIFRWMAVSS
jgi:hypothetical protein